MSTLPFRLRPDPDYLYLVGAQAALYASLRRASHSRPRISTLCGAEGVGKTTYLMAIARELEATHSVAWITQQDLTAPELLDALGMQFGLRVPEDQHASSHSLLDHFESEESAGRQCAVMVDDAQLLPEPTLRQLCKLCERRPGPCLLMAGTPALERQLRAQDIRFVPHALPRIDREEIPAYVQHRMKVAGMADAPPPAGDFAAEVYRYTGGTPKLMNIICDRAMSLAETDNVDFLSSRGIRNAAVDLKWTDFTSNDDSMNPAGESVPEPRAVCFQIEIHRAGMFVSRLPLRRGRSVVGRDAEADICLPSKFVSRQHCRFVVTDEACFVEDLSSTNGIQVNGIRTRVHEIRPGDVVTVGDHQINCAHGP